MFIKFQKQRLGRNDNLGWLSNIMKDKQNSWTNKRNAVFVNYHK